MDVFHVTNMRAPAPTPSITLCMSFSMLKEYLTFMLLLDTLASALAYLSSSSPTAPKDATVSASPNASSAHPFAIPEIPMAYYVGEDDSLALHIIVCVYCVCV